RADLAYVRFVRRARRQPIGDGVTGLGRDWPALFPRQVIGRRALGLHADDPDLRPEMLGCGSYSADQRRVSYRYVDGFRCRQLFQNLARNRRRSGGQVRSSRVIEKIDALRARVLSGPPGRSSQIRAFLDDPGPELSDSLALNRI